MDNTLGDYFLGLCGRNVGMNLDAILSGYGAVGVFIFNSRKRNHVNCAYMFLALNDVSRTQVYLLHLQARCSQQRCDMRCG
jgi:hypothetical protein